MADTNNVQAAQQTPKPNPALERLNAFVGKWKTEGEIKASSSAPSAKLKGTDTYEWLPGRFFLIHRVDVQMGDEKVDAIEIIGGYDASSQTYHTHSFDNQGNSVVMQAHVSDEDIWTFTGESMRFTGGFRDAGNTFAGLWEQRASGGSKWLPWMEIKLTKAA